MKLYEIVDGGERKMKAAIFSRELEPDQAKDSLIAGITQK